MELNNVGAEDDDCGRFRDIVSAAKSCFQKSPYRTLRRLSCRIEGDALILQGRLNTFFEKQLAQEMAAKIAGVALVVNEIEVIGLYNDD
jgi:hypothetical protein